MLTKPIIEQHFHGCFGVDFNKAEVDDIVFVSKEIAKYGVGGIFPTIVTDSIENTKHAIANIKQAAKNIDNKSAQILGIHLEGIFLNPEKKGIHDEKYFLKPTVENYKLIEDDFIKIVTLAPEINSDLISYLNSKGVKVQAGHCTGGNLEGCSGVTHLFNAMSGIHHRNPSTALSALINDNIYTEIIADGVHVSDDALRLVFKCKPLDKILLISDCLPCTNLKCCSELVSKSETKIPKQVRDNTYTFDFAGEEIFYDGFSAKSKDGTIAGSTTLLPDIIKLLLNKNIIDESSAVQLIENPYRYHNIKCDKIIEWDDNWNISR